MAVASNFKKKMGCIYIYIYIESNYDNNNIHVNNRKHINNTIIKKVIR